MSTVLNTGPLGQVQLESPCLLTALAANGGWGWAASMQAVIAHELGHLKCDHGVWLTVGNVLASGTLTLLPLLSGPVEDALIRWVRAAELTCDRAALLVVQDPRVVISVLMKLAGGFVAPFLSPERCSCLANGVDCGWVAEYCPARCLC